MKKEEKDDISSGSFSYEESIKQYNNFYSLQKNKSQESAEHSSLKSDSDFHNYHIMQMQGEEALYKSDVAELEGYSLKSFSFMGI